MRECYAIHCLYIFWIVNPSLPSAAHALTKAYSNELKDHLVPFFQRETRDKQPYSDEIASERSPYTQVSWCCDADTGNRRRTLAYALLLEGLYWIFLAL
jgi:hypothetical protein